MCRPIFITIDSVFSAIWILKKFLLLTYVPLNWVCSSHILTEMGSFLISSCPERVYNPEFTATEERNVPCSPCFCSQFFFFRSEILEMLCACQRNLLVISLYLGPKSLGDGLTEHTLFVLLECLRECISGRKKDIQCQLLIRQCGLNKNYQVNNQNTVSNQYGLGNPANLPIKLMKLCGCCRS